MTVDVVFEKIYTGEICMKKIGVYKNEDISE